MGIITTGNFAKSIWPGVNGWYGQEYVLHIPEWPEIYEHNTSRKAFEEDVGVTGYGLASIKESGDSVSYDSQEQGFIDRYTHVTYGIGMIITREAVEDDLYDVVARKKARGLAFSMRQTKEVVAANPLNRAFNGNYTYGDGKELCSTLHPNVSGGTWQNESTTAADFSEAAIEQAIIDIGNFKTDRGLVIKILAKKLIIPQSLECEAARVLKSILQSDSSENNVNALRLLGKIPQISVNHYLTSTSAYFILTNCPDGMKYFERRGDEFNMDSDFDTENAKFKATGRYSVGCTDKRSIWGSPGV